MKSQFPLCTCCQGTDITAEATLTSLFLSRAAFAGAPEHTDLYYCNSCGFRFYERKISDSEAQRYYSDYRGDRYVTERGRDELFYNQAAYERDGAWMASPRRRLELLEVLDIAGIASRDLRVVDFGGGDGTLISGLDVRRRAVFDLSDAPTLPDVEKLRSNQATLGDWDLVICAQTLEHISNPDVTLATLRDLAAPGGLIYIELPQQQWRSFSWPGFIRDKGLALAKKNRTAHKILDLYSTAFRVKLKLLPPLGFVPMREHVNFFTENSISELGARFGMTLEVIRTSKFCGIQALFRKPS